MLQLGPDPTAPYLSKSEQSIWSPKSTSSTMVIDAHKIYTFIGAKYYHQKSRKSLTFAISRYICQIWSTRALSTQLNWGTNATHMNNCEDAIICSGLLLSCISWRICWGLVQAFVIWLTLPLAKHQQDWQPSIISNESILQMQLHEVQAVPF